MAGCSFMDMAHQPTFDIREDPCQPRVLLVTALSAVLPWPAAMTYLPAGPSCPLAWGHRHIARRTPWSCRPHPQPHGSPHGSRTDTCSCRGGDGARARPQGPRGSQQLRALWRPSTQAGLQSQWATTCQTVGRDPSVGALLASPWPVTASRPCPGAASHGRPAKDAGP